MLIFELEEEALLETAVTKLSSSSIQKISNQQASFIIHQSSASFRGSGFLAQTRLDDVQRVVANGFEMVVEIDEHHFGLDHRAFLHALGGRLVVAFAQGVHFVLDLLGAFQNLGTIPGDGIAGDVEDGPHARRDRRQFLVVERQERAPLATSQYLLARWLLTQHLARLPVMATLQLVLTHTAISTNMSTCVMPTTQVVVQDSVSILPTQVTLVFTTLTFLLPAQTQQHTLGVKLLAVLAQATLSTTVQLVDDRFSLLLPTQRLVLTLLYQLPTLLLT